MRPFPATASRFRYWLLLTLLLGAVAAACSDEAPTDVTPVPATATARPGETPQPSPDLEALALKVGELPEGFEVSAEGADEEPAGKATYVRDFSAADVPVAMGGADVISLQHSLMEFEDEREAAAFLRSVATLLDGDAGSRFLTSLLTDEGLDVIVLSTQRKGFELGDESVAYVASAATGDGDFTLAYVLTRQDAIVSAFVVVAEGNSFKVSSLLPPAKRVAERIETPR